MNQTPRSVDNDRMLDTTRGDVLVCVWAYRSRWYVDAISLKTGDTIVAHTDYPTRERACRRASTLLSLAGRGAL